MACMKHTTFARVLVYSVAAVLFALACSSCKSSEATFARAKFATYADATMQSTPSSLLRFDLKGGIMFANAYAVASVETADGFPIYGPVTKPAGRVFAWEFGGEKWTWDAQLPAVLPERTRRWFTAEEIALWGLAFEAPDVTVTTNAAGAS